jgi:hypothetical protein
MRRAVSYKLTDVSKVLASIISPMNLWNIGKLLPDYMAQHPRRLSSSILVYFFFPQLRFHCRMMIPSDNVFSRYLSPFLCQSTRKAGSINPSSQRLLQEMKSHTKASGQGCAAPRTWQKRADRRRETATNRAPQESPVIRDGTERIPLIRYKVLVQKPNYLLVQWNRMYQNSGAIKSSEKILFSHDKFSKRWNLTLLC